jgi:hypothetical protein
VGAVATNLAPKNSTRIAISLPEASGEADATRGDLSIHCLAMLPVLCLATFAVFVGVVRLCAPMGARSEQTNEAEALWAEGDDSVGESGGLVAIVGDDNRRGSLRPDDRPQVSGEAVA